LLVTVLVAAVPGAAAARPDTVMLHQKWRRATAGYVTSVQAAGQWVFTTGPLTPGGQMGTAVNEQTGQRRSITPLPGCFPPTLLGAAQLLFNCSSEVAIESLGTGALTTVVQNPELTSYESNCESISSGDMEYSCGLAPVAVGARWVEFDESCSGHCLESGDPPAAPDTYVFENIQSGAIQADPTSATTYPDLSYPGLARTLCAPLRVPKLSMDSYGLARAGFGSMVFDGSFAIAGGGADGSQFFLERCGSRVHERLAPAGSAPLVEPHVVLWERTDEARSKCPGTSVELDGLFLPDRHPFILCFPAFLFGGGFAVSARHVFAVDQNGGLWATPIPIEPRRSHK
jgi:hypothetical protein